MLQILFSPTCPQPLPHHRRRAEPPWGGRTLTSPCRREWQQPSDLPQVACFGSSGLETVPTVPGTLRWRAHCSNSVFSLSLHPLPPAICMTKSSGVSKDCPGRVTTPVSFFSPSIGSRNPAPSSCESPQGCGHPLSPTSATSASRPRPHPTPPPPTGASHDTE